jgi:hypothetical protein
MPDPQTIYLAVVNDRHTDTEVEPFTTAEAAIGYARARAAENSADGRYEEAEIRGWLFYARYSVEGDSVWVVAKELLT